MQRDELEKCVRALDSNAPIVGGWIRRHSLGRLVREKSPEAVGLLAEFIASSPDDAPSFDPVVHELGRVVSQNCFDALCEVWSRTRSRTLSRLIQQSPCVASAPPRVRVLTSLLCSAPAYLAREPKQVAPALFEALEDPDPEIADRAREWVLEPPHSALEAAFLELAMLEEGPGRLAVLKSGYLPREPDRRALFLLLTGQDAAFEALDYDFSLVSKAYRDASPALRSRVNQRLRQWGRPDLLTVIARTPSQHLPLARTWGEWETVYQVLCAAGDWDALWRSVFDAPMEWSARVVRTFQARGLLPPESDRETFRELAESLPEPGELRCLGFACSASYSEDRGPILSIAGTDHGDLLAVLPRERDPSLWQLPQSHQLTWSEREVAAVKPPTVPLSRPKSELFSLIRIAPNGQWVAAIGDNGEFCVWDRRGELRRNSNSLQVRQGMVDFAFTGEGDQVAVLLRQEVRVLKARNPDERPLSLRTHLGANLEMAASADGRILVSGEEAGTVCVWSMPEARRFATLEMQFSIAALHVSAKHIVAADVRGAVRVWGRENGNLIRGWEIGEGRITHLAVSPSETWLAIGCRRQRTVLRRLDSDAECKQPGPSGGDPVALGFLSDDCLIICPKNRQIVIWNPEFGETWDRPTVDARRATSFWLDSANEQFAVGGSEGVVRLFQAMGDAPRGSIDAEALARRLQRAEDPRTIRTLKFALTLLRHPVRYEIAIGESTMPVPEEYDIEIEG